MSKNKFPLNLNEDEKIEKLNNELQRIQSKTKYTYTAISIIGNGTFGIVYKAILKELDNQIVAIKRVFQDERYKNRELQIMQELNHPNLVKLLDFFYTKVYRDNMDEVYLNVVMKYMPETLGQILRRNYKEKNNFELLDIKLYSFQIIKSLAYLHSLNICHRDLKPQNILINQQNRTLKICDFGSAKKLENNQKSIAYICSRYYRAPELTFGCTHYTVQIDIWSLGCIIGEMLYGQPIFPGENASDQLVEIIKILGTPTKEQIYKMNPEYRDHKFPIIKSYPWEKVFKSKNYIDKNFFNSFIDLISKMLIYEPDERIKPMKALTHEFFNELKYLDYENRNDLPKDLYEFTQEEINSDPESYKLIMQKD